MNADALRGLGLALAAVIAAAAGNLCARWGQRAGATLHSSLAWAMAYGALLLAVLVLITRRRWTFDFSPAYVISLVYLTVAASVVAFVLYFGLARRRGYTTASYVVALTPVLAVTMSTLFEGKTWSRLSVMGIALVLGGQWMIIRSQSAPVEDWAERRTLQSSV